MAILITIFLRSLKSIYMKNVIKFHIKLKRFQSTSCARFPPERTRKECASDSSLDENALIIHNEI